MRKHLFVLIAVLLSACAMRGQSFVSVEEGKIRAFLKNDSTVISVPVVSFADHPVKAELALSWVNTDGSESDAIVHNIVIPTGQSSTETPLEIGHSSIWTRLRYTITPDRSDARAFMPATGIVALAHIAAHVFEVRASYAGLSRPGSPITVHAQAIHPVTRQPVLGVEWTATLSFGKRDDVPPVKVLQHPEGFADFTFDLPTPSKDDSEEEGR